MKKVVVAVATLAVSATTASALAFDVPEISALEGTAALAAVAAIVLLAWERRSRS